MWEKLTKGMFSFCLCGYFLYQNFIEIQICLRKFIKNVFVAGIEIIDPAALGPALSPGSSSTVPEASSPNTTPESNITPALSPPAPESDTTSTLTPPSTDGGSGVLTPPSTGGASGVPTTDAGSRPSLTPSSVASCYANSAFVLVASEVTFILYFLF
ncbi:hypothetical protein HanPI659440_Chr09g0324521 [Helianthus annuus]|uniref:Uncharacterized protein n=1 Tax=Helianthus annuus TaxID=4232 RepID=A0A9K3N7I8_HELAN|nr:hypothetical protein HanXRQr2_Chr09g0374341 [Helianthus annuus]KAJ0533056.1 hypothetical protein HanIR_Chr09g0404021 [Helianthus annuus]KAJ0541422.1 hypothetical protein HanHA89_Chr09g0328311 [Helianthus annuus]KAJ0706502.1 hypothetical protein HanLR1_Chr09g0307791 [Helianthus annuus]KAJ0710528.1 hypothetical protein HanOQP8_Chr09g0313461 [Helianthus annuus]